MMERFDDDDLPRATSVRDRLRALDDADRARITRRAHRPHRDMVWLVVVLAALLAALLWEGR